MPSFPELSAPLAALTAQLRLAAERDIPEILIAHQDDPGLHRATGAERPPSGAELGRRVERSAGERAAGAGVWLTITAAGDDRCIGQMSVHNVDWDHRRAEVGIWLVPDRRGHGLAACALGLAGRWLLRECGLMRVELFTAPENTAMQRAALAAGFSEEGVLRAYRREGGRRRDARVMSLVAADLGEGS